MTFCDNLHNIVDSKHATTGASSPPMAIVQMTLEGGRFASVPQKMKGICGGMGAAAMIDPPEQIAACSYCANGICKPPMKLRQSEVLY